MGAAAFVGSAFVAGMAITVVAHGGIPLAHATSQGGHGAPARPAAVTRAISYAWAQVGRQPYCWGGTGASCPNPPYHGYDCSGLMFKAYGFPPGLRTSQQQWAGLPHVPASQARPGDLVFAPGSDGTRAKPGHVGMLLSRDRVVQAYAPGYLVSVTSLSNFAAGAGGITGFARPTGGA
jgi:cell wall-associated NlpC family hydrolase